MEKNNRNVLIAGILSVILVLLIVRNIFSSRLVRMASRAPVPISRSGNLSALVSMRQNEAIYKDQWKSWNEDLGRNPFIPVADGGRARQRRKPTNWCFRGIFWDETNPKAVINDRTLAKGDTLGAYRVVEIKQGSVVLRTGEKNVEVSVFQPISSKNASSQ